jgi:hypothetical protein
MIAIVASVQPIGADLENTFTSVSAGLKQAGRPGRIGPAPDIS